MEDWSTLLTIVVMPLMAAIGAFARELFEAFRSHRSAALEELRTDAEVSAALRDDLVHEIQRTRELMAQNEARHLEREKDYEQRISDLLDSVAKIKLEAAEQKARADILERQLEAAKLEIANLQHHVAALEAAKGAMDS